MPSDNSKRNYGNTMVMKDGLQNMPDSDTVVIAKDALLYEINIVNPNAGIMTYSVTDNSDPVNPKFVMIDRQVQPNSFSLVRFGEGVLMNGGIRWYTSAIGAGKAMMGELKAWTVEK